MYPKLMAKALTMLVHGLTWKPFRCENSHSQTIASPDKIIFIYQRLHEHHNTELRKIKTGAIWFTATTLLDIPSTIYTTSVS